MTPGPDRPDASASGDADPAASSDADPSAAGDADHEVDARGRLCPLPVIDLARAARHASDGDLVDLVADDPAAASDVLAWCRMRGHTLVSSTPFAPDPTATVYRVRLTTP